MSLISRALTDTNGNVAAYDGAAEGEYLKISSGRITGTALEPGGTTGQAQYNNAGALAGAASTTVLSGGQLSHAREQEVKLVTEPTAAADGYLHLYGASRAQRGLPAYKGSIGTAAPLQPSIFGRRISQTYVAAAALQTLGTWSFATVGTPTRQAFSATAANKIAATTRTRYATTAATGQAAGLYASADVCYRAATAGCGGFFFHARFGLDAAPGSGTRFFVGLTAKTDTTTLTTGDPSAAANSIGLYKDAADSNYRVISVDGTSPTPGSTKDDCGFAPANNDLIDVYIWAAPNGSSISVAVHDLNANSVAIERAFTTNLPANNVGLRAQILGGTGTGSTALQFCFVQTYLETDL